MMEVYTSKKLGGTMVKVTKKEALRIIESLATQMFEENPNTGRAEFNDDTGNYFSIAVSDGKEIPKPRKKK